MAPVSEFRVFRRGGVGVEEEKGVSIFRGVVGLLLLGQLALKL